jgi:hypothetical protein
VAECDVIRRVLAWIGAAVFALCAVLGLWTVGQFAVALYPLIQLATRESGSGGMGGVSVGFSEGIGWQITALLPSIVLNRVLASRARLERGLFGSLHRAQSILLLAVGALVLVLVIVAFAGISGVVPFITVMFLILLAISLQCLALAGVLTLSAG